MKITAKTKLGKILEIKGAENVLHKNNVPCVTCPYMAMEINKLTLGYICQAYELDLDKILKDLNNLK